MKRNTKPIPKNCPSRTRNYKTVLGVRLVAAFVTLVLVVATSGILAVCQFANAQPAIADHAQAAPQAAQQTKPATVLVYMNGSDLESEAGEASSDISEMLESGIGNNANVVIQTMGTKQWQDHNIASDHTQRLAITNGELKVVDDTLGQLDTTDPKTLSDFIRWGVEQYPADRYMLIMWNHGAGPVYGFGYDEWQGDYAALTLNEMQQALKENDNVHFDLIGMDCCIMSSLETYYVLQPFCDYAILSEDFEPVVGWSYANWMSMLEKDPTTDTVTLGKTIVDDMIAAVEEDPENGDATLALVDESAILALYNAWVDFAYENKATLLGTNYSQEVSQRGRFVQHAPGAPNNAPNDSNVYPGMPDGDDLGTLSNDPYDLGPHLQNDWYGTDEWYDMWDSDASYVTMSDYYVTDIMSVATSIDSAKASALKSAMEKAIVHYSKTSGETNMEGIGVTLPYGDSEFYDQLKEVFGACGIDQNYVSWLEEFVEAEGANDYYDYETTESPGTEGLG
ncbi:MAG: clostripain-related cysteine peptidase, partial [Coriobacteriales bacterium]|nr:clostripain-related cysteine peptidase [Coriobacteriales bacterium]